MFLWNVGASMDCLEWIKFHLVFLKIYLFIYLCLRWVFVAVRRLSLVAVSRGYSSL